MKTKPILSDSMLTTLIINWNGNYSSKGRLRKKVFMYISTLNTYLFNIITIILFDLNPDDNLFHSRTYEFNQKIKCVFAGLISYGISA